MHSTIVRVQNCFGFFTTVAFCTALLTALSVLCLPQSPSASVEPVLRNVQVYEQSHQNHGEEANNSSPFSVKGRPNYYSTKKEEYAHIKFDLDAGTCYPVGLDHSVDRLQTSHRSSTGTRNNCSSGFRQHTRPPALPQTRLFPTL